jgi:heterodisulfide reductase subunit B2
MTSLAFYPGCALESMSWDYRESLRSVASALDNDLVDLRDWTCCGATAAHSLDERMSVILPARNLAEAQAMGHDLAVACPMCFKRLSHSRRMLEQKRADAPWTIHPDLNVFDMARWLGSGPMLSRVRDRVRTPLDGLRVVCYYGCQVVRPPKYTGATDYENPQHLDRLAAAVGATVLDWSFKGTCCGASVGIPKREIGQALVGRLIRWARASGAQAIVVCCPLCQSNLDLYQAQLQKPESMLAGEPPLPVFYYTELLGIAFGLESVRAGLRCHVVDPLPLMEPFTRA